MHTPDVGSGALLATGAPEASAPLSVRRSHGHPRFQNWKYLDSSKYLTFEFQLGSEVAKILHQDLCNESQKAQDDRSRDSVRQFGFSVVLFSCRNWWIVVSCCFLHYLRNIMILYLFLYEIISYIFLSVILKSALVII